MQRLEIENLGKLDHAEIRLGGLTVFAGPNNTGKSFVSKLLYSIFNAMSVNPAQARLQRWLAPIRTSVRILAASQHRSAPDVSKILSEMEDLIVSLPSETELADSTISSLRDKTTRLQQRLRDSQNADTEAFRQEDERDFGHVAVEDINKSLANLRGEINSFEDAWGFVVSELEYSVARNLVKNFQIPNVVHLKGSYDADLHVSLRDTFQVVMSDGKIKLEIDQSSLRTLVGLSNTIYLESPIYWKLSNALKEIQFIPTMLNGSRERERLTAVPGYFYDLAAELRFEYTGDVAFPEVFEWLIGHDAISGKISVSRSGDMSFEQGGRSFPLQTTATGVANLGILALLIERKIIDHGTVLFIDEPEAHLHPAWQVIVAEALFRLAKAGVKVVVATHSLDILKWLEVWVKKNPDDEKIVALNQFPVLNGDDEAFDQRMAKIKGDLTKPFFDLYLDGA